MNLNKDSYLEKSKEVQQSLLDFLDNELDSDDEFINFTQLIKDQKISDDKFDLELLLNLIVKISNYHYRFPEFFTKLGKIFSFIKNDILRHYSNSELFRIFKSNKRLLLLLIEMKLFEIDKTIFSIITSDDYLQLGYPCYFYPEIKKFIKDSIKFSKEIESEISKDSVSFQYKREQGENDHFICGLIRNDSVEDFVQFVSMYNYALSSTIEPSINETNRFLIKNTPTLLEYSAFFGSIQIFQYLYLNHVELSPSLWLYAIHGKNPELIHILEENKIIPLDSSFQKCFNQAIKCHNLDFADYIFNNLNSGSNDFDCIKSLSVYNYSFFPKSLSNHLVELCKYNYFNLVSILLKNGEIQDILIDNVFI